MTRGLNIDLSVDGVLSSQIQLIGVTPQPNGVTPQPTLHTGRILVLILTVSLFSVAQFVLLVFTLIALTNSNNESVHSACGSTLWALVLVDVVLPVVIVCIGIICGCCMGCASVGVGGDLCYKSITFLLVIGLTVSMFVLGIYNVQEGNTTIENTACKLAMSDTAGGLNSPSANMGTPLLAIVAIIHGAVFLSSAGGITIGLTLTAVIFCRTKRTQTRQPLVHPAQMHS